MSDQIGGYAVHQYAAKFPLMTGDDFDDLITSIKSFGQLEPITLSADGATIIDGRNRLRACLVAGITPQITQLDEAFTELDILKFILGKNLERRHLTPGQRVALVEHLRPALKAEARERQLAGIKNPNPEKGGVDEQMAELAGVGHDTVARYTRVAETAPDLAQAIRNGDLSVNAAYEEIRGEQRFKLDGTPALKRGPKPRILLTDPDGLEAYLVPPQDIKVHRWVLVGALNPEQAKTIVAEARSLGSDVYRETPQ